MFSSFLKLKISFWRSRYLGSCLLASLLFWAPCEAGTPSPQAQEHEALALSDVKPVVDEMLSIHIQYHKLTPKLFSKILSQYFEEFDPDDLYLLQSEIDAYVAVNETRLSKQIEAFQQADYSLFEEMDRVIQKAIWRAKQSRALNKTPKTTKDRVSDRANTLSDLQERWAILVSNESFKEKLRVVEAKELEYLYLNDQQRPLDEKMQAHFRTLHILKAFASSLDAHTAVFSRQEASSLIQALNPHSVGVGIVLVRENNAWYIQEVVAESPAAKSKNILPGDRLLEINGQALKGDERDLELLKHPEGKVIQLVIDRKGERITTQLQVSALESIGLERLRPNERIFDGGKRIGYIAMDSFYEGDNPSISSEADLIKAIEAFKKTGPLNALVLDLRQNMGGYLGQAVKVVGLFITNGVVVISKYSDGSVHYYRDTDPSRAFTGPVVVLTSRLSASAAEIVAQSLQDYGVAVVVGDRNTFGKGSIQTHTFGNPDAQAYYKVTVGRYYTVSGKSTQLNGVPIDIIVPGPYDRINIGEKYQRDPLQPDSVLPSFADTLSDVENKDRLWMMQHYLPTLQAKSSKWQPIIPRLREASQHRQDLFFQKKSLDTCTDQELWDMQTAEAFEIAHEMISYK
jgi:carboxyl-terminal processing protease